MQSKVASLEEVVCILVYLAEKRTEDAHKLVDESILESEEDFEDDAMEILESIFLNL